MGHDTDCVTKRCCLHYTVLFTGTVLMFYVAFSIVLRELLCIIYLSNCTASAIDSWFK